MKAAENGHIEIAQLLLDRSANVNAKNKKGRDSLSFAAAPSMRRETTEFHHHMLRLLVSKGADPLRKDERGRTAKDIATHEGRHEIIKVLEELECGQIVAWP